MFLATFNNSFGDTCYGEKLSGSISEEVLASQFYTEREMFVSMIFNKLLSTFQFLVHYYGWSSKQSIVVIN